MAVGDFGPSAIEHILRFLKESGHRLQLFLLYYIFSVFSIAVFAKLFRQDPQKIQHSERKGQKDNIFL